MFISLLAIVASVFGFGINAYSGQNISLEGVRNSERSSLADERYILELINDERARRSLPDLYWNSSLADLARSHSKKMARDKFFSHVDGSGKSVQERAAAMKLRKWRMIGENLFMCEGIDDFAELAVRGWMRSTGHRQNILNDRYNETGIGIAKARDGTIYVTQVFIEK